MIAFGNLLTINFYYIISTPSVQMDDTYIFMSKGQKWFFSLKFQKIKTKQLNLQHIGDRKHYQLNP